MYTVTFCLDLGDCLAIYTGRIEARTDTTYLVKYFEPTLQDYYCIHLSPDQIISCGYSEVRMLPLVPVVQDLTGKSAINQLVQPIYA